MKNWKKYASLLLALTLFSLALLTGCGSSGRKWRDTDVIDGYCTVERYGKQIDVCVCHDQKAIYFYYNDEEHELLDTAMLPTDKIYDDDKDWCLGEISIDDLTGDNNSDLKVYLHHADMSKSCIVWMWEEGTGYVYQPDYSWFYEHDVIYDPPYDDPEVDFSMYEGMWLCDTDNQTDVIYIQFDEEGNWELYSNDEMIDDGYLWYVQEEDTTYIYGYQGGTIDGGQVELEGERLNITTIGYFSHLASEDDNGELHHQDISVFEGTWYYDGDPSADLYIIIDGNGNWSYFQRASGDAEGTEMDYGTFSYSTDESYVYYANSAMYDGLSILVLDFDDGIIIWGDEGAYYRIDG